MNEEPLFNPNLETRLLKLEANFKKNNPLGYQQRSNLGKEVTNHNTYVFHKIYDDKVFITFTINISKYKWDLLNAWKKPSDAFHANDITRLQYLEAAKQGNFMGYLPQYVILDTILNKNTTAELDAISNEDLVEVFPTTIHGKRIKYLFNDFGLTIKDINFQKHDDGSLHKRTIIIDTNLLPV